MGGDIATSIFIAGWATGGLFFGMLGDRIGRAKTMMITILLYSLFTGLSALSVGLWDFAFYRFLTGLGVGGEFAVGVALVAEVMPNNARPYTLGLLQALSAVGNVSAAMVNLSLGLAEEQGLPYSPWRIMFLIGAIPALLALVVRRYLKEPEQWTAASTSELKEKQLGSYTALFKHPVWRKHALLGLVLGCAGVVGLWSVGFYTPDLTREIQKTDHGPGPRRVQSGSWIRNDGSNSRAASKGKCATQSRRPENSGELRENCERATEPVAKLFFDYAEYWRLLWNVRIWCTFTKDRSKAHICDCIGSRFFKHRDCLSIPDGAVADFRFCADHGFLSVVALCRLRDLFSRAFPNLAQINRNQFLLQRRAFCGSDGAHRQNWSRFDLRRLGTCDTLHWRHNVLCVPDWLVRTAIPARNQGETTARIVPYFLE